MEARPGNVNWHKIPGCHGYQADTAIATYDVYGVVWDV